MGRGGGHHFFDFQFRPEAGFVAFPARQGDLRAVTEAMPGDRHLSQTDEERFPLSNRIETTPFTYLAMVDQQRPFLGSTTGEPAGKSGINICAKW